MRDFARVDSIDALKDFRVSLCKFADAIKVGLDEAESEIDRTAIWLKQDQYIHWKRQVRKYQELLTRARIELNRKQQQKTPLGGRYSCVDEKKALAVAKRRFEEAEQKLANVRRWTRQLEQETFAYKGVAQGLIQVVDADVPNALAQLDNMIAALESYASSGTASEQGSVRIPEPHRPDQQQERGSNDTGNTAPP
jgi:hypothetical protein